MQLFALKISAIWLRTLKAFLCLHIQKDTTCTFRIANLLPLWSVLDNQSTYKQNPLSLLLLIVKEFYSSPCPQILKLVRFQGVLSTDIWLWIKSPRSFIFTPHFLWKGSFNNHYSYVELQIQQSSFLEYLLTMNLIFFCVADFILST